ncbi:centrosomal protein of 290 kDa-like [Mizuhopecten yessoensis]|uniref:centrosomal protein of 290 kDa-like n=1 Tax=Mizuhopecten yessoensis TaxID=6573 RepID=UPI000B45B817|nr:centrosomal protein of 290 kDa-like [Mizuhopecten yessoensis]
MSFPDIHTCIKLTAENEDLKKKLFRVKQQRDAYQSELTSIKEKAKVDALLKTYVTTRESSTQTDPSRVWHPVAPKKNEDTVANKITEGGNTNRLMSMHSNVMRRYEKEVKMNLGHLETITELQMKISTLEKRLQQEKENVQQMEKEIHSLRVSKATAKVKAGNVGKHGKELSSDEDESKDRHVVRECRKLRKENKKLKEELKGLDLGFFEEIEDIKFAFQQAARLNVEYEKTIKKLCQQFGVAYPHPERTVK